MPDFPYSFPPPTETIVERDGHPFVPPAPPREPIDIEALAERVYRLMRDDVLRDRERI